MAWLTEDNKDLEWAVEMIHSRFPAPHDSSCQWCPEMMSARLDVLALAEPLRQSQRVEEVTTLMEEVTTLMAECSEIWSADQAARDQRIEELEAVLKRAFEHHNNRHGYCSFCMLDTEAKP